MLLRTIFIIISILIWIYVTFFIILPIKLTIIIVLYTIVSLLGFISLSLFFYELLNVIKNKI